MTTEPPGADEAFTALYQREFRIAAHAAYVVTGSSSRAQDLAQEAMAVAYARWDRVQHFDRPGAWVRRVAINLALKDCTRSARQQPIAEGHEVAARAGADGETLVVLAAAIRQLPEQQRVAVVLHYFHDLPIIEVAESLGCAEATTRVHLHRARTRLASLLGDELRDR